jgi:hypothetical protein
MRRYTDIKQFFEVGPSVWIGDYPAFESHSVNIYKSSNFRLAPELHGRFKAVWLYERLLSDVSAWKVVLDEAIRLIDSEGVMIVRFQQNELLNIFEFKSFLGRSVVLESIEVLYESHVDGEFTIALSLQRFNYATYKNKRWSFAVLTQGTKVDNVVRFCRSVRATNNGSEHEIIICGPENEHYKEFEVCYLDKKYDDRFAQIALKKNDIANVSSNDNLMIVHDRYELNDDFFDGFERYGYDFDFLTIRQFYESCDLFPSYLALSKRMKWSDVNYSEDESNFSDGSFLNGGLLIFKKNTLNRVRFNKLLFWNQAEDVELANAMIIHGVVPRLNLMATATTMGIDKSYTKTFKKISIFKKDLYLFDRALKKILTIAKRILPEPVKNKIKAVVKNG